MFKTILDTYKEKLIDTIETVYNGELNHDWIVKYVNDLTKKAETKQLKAHCRNLFKYMFHFEKDPNEIPKEIGEHEFNILANGLYTENKRPANYFIISKWKSLRKQFKNLMLKARESGDHVAYKSYNAKQYKVKANTNAIYGASTMSKGWCSNIDMGGAITAQARNFISEQVWCIERFLSSNYAFYNINEIFLFINELFKIKSKEITPEDLKDLDYIPTSDDCRKRFIQITMDVPGLRKKLNKMQQSVFLMFEMMDDWKRVAFYYANNPLEFIARNSKIYDIFDDIIKMDIEFINPYSIPEELKTHMDTIFYYMNKFVYSKVIIGERVEKYLTKKRKACVVGDTDSTMPSLNEFVDNIFKIFGREDLIEDYKTHIRVSMVSVSIVSNLLDECCKIYVKKCNSDHGDKLGDGFFMRMKNEFFFPVLLLFPGKKNYIGLQTIQEGKMVPEEEQLAITGAALGASGNNEYVINTITNLIKQLVLEAHVYDPLKLVKGINALQEHIKQQIRSGDKTFGIYKRYAGMTNIKDPERTATIRSVCIWNEIFPNDYISPGDEVYQFDTNLLTEADLDRMNPKYEKIRERIREVVFRSRGSMDFSRFGLKTFVVPAFGDQDDIPEWLIPFINIQAIVEKHLKPMTTLYSSLLLSPSTYRVNGTKKQGTSTLVRW